MDYDHDMRKAFPTVLIVAFLLAIITACVVRGGPRTVVREQRACPPAHHWEGGDCVHNGNGHGKHKKFKD